MGAKGRMSQPIPDYYYERLRRNLSLCLKYKILEAGSQVLELGTGWVHWDALTLGLFFDVKTVLFDVWDNRQLAAFMAYLGQLNRWLPVSGLGCGHIARAQSLIAKVLRLNSFEEIYQVLGFRYVLDAAGCLKMLEPGAFSLVISGGVLEHIGREQVPGSVGDWVRVLKPGGYAIHGINIKDHLYLYDRSVSPKQYLAYSDSVWHRYLENEVQYINRLQRSEWLRIFSGAGLQVAEEVTSRADVSALKISDRYRGLSESDLECTTLHVVLQKLPAA